MRPSGCKEKGSAFELEVAKRIATLMGIDQKKWLQRSPESGARPVWKGDIVPVAKLAEYWPFHIECKKQQGWDLQQILESDKCLPITWFKEAIDQAFETDKSPLIIFALNYRKWLIAYEPTLFPAKKRLHITVETDNGIEMRLDICPFEEFAEYIFHDVWKKKVKECGIA
jgi:hypothetical protein